MIQQNTGDEREVSGMEEDDILGVLRGTTIQLVRECRDADLLDLICKLLSQQVADHPVNSKVYQDL